jgi:2,3-dihydroxybiphenyl 1,2-dioxygenase
MTQGKAMSLFGKVKMGYLVAESGRLTEWQRFMKEGLGMHVDAFGQGLLAGRIDAHERRFIVQKGTREDVAAIGWQLADESAMELALRRLRDLAIDVQEIGGLEASGRGVDRLWRIKGPKGLATELFIHARSTIQPLSMKASGFMTGEGGMGHVAITTRQPAAMQSFWKNIFDARLSDHIEQRIDGVQLELTFLRLNERHHSIATAATRGIRLNPLRTQIHHVNLQTASLDDVIHGYLRCRALGYDIASAIGQHPNDRELSFYVVSPSGFEVELGWDPVVVDEAHWVPTTYQGMSLWGHRPENLTLAYRLGRLKQGVTSLMRDEFMPEGVQR